MSAGRVPVALIALHKTLNSGISSRRHLKKSAALVGRVRAAPYQSSFLKKSQMAVGPLQ
jgi:hypothetical protein